MDRPEILSALEALGTHRALAGVEAMIVVLAGRSAGILTGQIEGRTHDCDVVAWPNGYSQAGRVEQCARDIAGELGLARDWFNSECYQVSGWKLPADYQDRWETVGRFGPLDVRCISRIDFIAMKFLATRDRDMKDLEMLDPTGDELRWIADRLETIDQRAGADAMSIAVARARLKGMLQRKGVQLDGM